MVYRTSPKPHFLSLIDKNVPEKYQPTIATYRAEGRRQNVQETTPLCYRVRAGYTLEQHAPLFGSYYEDFQYLQSWDFKDKPTSNCLVFWIPRVVPGSNRKSVSEQMACLAKLRASMELPAHHLASFGSTVLLAGLILAHFKVTGERVPLDNYWVRTDDTYNAEGYRLILGHFDEGGLYCDYWDWAEDAYGTLAAFALGVELGSSGT